MSKEFDDFLDFVKDNIDDCVDEVSKRVYKDIAKRSGLLLSETQKNDVLIILTKSSFDICISIVQKYFQSSCEYRRGQLYELFPEHDQGQDEGT